MPFTSSSPRSLSHLNFVPSGSTKLGLAHLSGHRVAELHADALQRFDGFVFHGDAQHARNAGNAVIGEATDQPQVAGVFVTPDKGRSHVVANPAIDAIEPL